MILKLRVIKRDIQLLNLENGLENSTISVKSLYIECYQHYVKTQQKG